MRALFMTILAAAALSLAGVPAYAQQKLKIATEGAYPPFNSVDASGKLVGFEIDFANALCERMKVQCEIVAQEWDGIIPGLLARKYDAIIASMSITDERKKAIDFTRKYYSATGAFVVPKNSKITSIAPGDLKGLSVGAQSATTHSSLIEDKFKGVTARLYGTVDEALRDLSSGRIDAVFGDKVALTPWLESKDGGCCKLVGGDVRDPGLGEGVGIGIRKGETDLREQLNKAITSLLEDGTLKGLNDKYFRYDIL